MLWDKFVINKAAIIRYAEMRDLARLIAKEKLQDEIDAGLFDTRYRTYQGIEINVTPIDEAALSAWEQDWSDHDERLYAWDWRVERREWRTTLRCTDAAIWADGMLCGLMIGCATKGRAYLRVDVLEGSPDPNHPLKNRIAYCVTQIGLAFGTIFGCRELALMRPIDDAIPLYEELGFKLAMTPNNVRYCSLRI
ncbi:hypothetical protein RsS62_28180 [Rhizobium dioscoreae]|uniref:hypothetical protein n=1 Tax=Rhizobium dioscoreae TaxID=2653122 RepID=UPI000DE15F84|nr:hypothetical protein [Rhizobium dioscoreae]GES43566.1 hypothetical protein RsS62_28180 [Rhizobium dioscoreae]